jgi:NAD(P)-dependent dehydrogenase (short-subunit alcohol dehydrogenase family)
MNIDLSGEVAVVTGGGGVLCSAISRALAGAGARVAVLDFRLEAAEAVAREIERVGGSAFALRADVLDSRSLEDAAHRVEETIGQVSILVNGAGGNKKEATTSAELSFFDLPREAIEWVFQLNFLGTFLPSQVFGKRMAARKRGNILNIASMNAFRPLTKIPAYSAAKAAVTNFTQWLAVHLARTCSSEIRVNALAPGFFLTDQNRFLLTDASGTLTERGRQIIDHTPMGRFGAPEDLLGTALWLVSKHSAFVTGVTIPVDGGFAAYSGV